MVDILNYPIHDISLSVRLHMSVQLITHSASQYGHVTYLNFLLYQYYGGCILAAVGRFSDAIRMFEAVSA